MFSKKGNEDILIDLLSCILNEKIANIEVIKDASLSKTAVKEKYGILDLKVKIKDKIIDMEMQVVDQLNMKNRTVYYGSKLLSSQLIEGEDYSNLESVIIISILDFEFLKGKQYLTDMTFLPRDKNRTDMIDYLRLIFIELPKYRKQKGKEKSLKKLEEWIAYIDHKDEEEVKMAVKVNEKIRKADEEVEYLTGDAEKRRLSELHSKYIHDKANYIYTGKMQGLEEGKMQGEINQKIEATKKFSKLGVSIDIISKALNLSTEEINNILKDKR